MVPNCINAVAACFRTQTKQSARVSRLPAAAGSAEALLLQNGGGGGASKLVNGTAPSAGAGGANGVSSSDEDMETN